MKRAGHGHGDVCRKNVGTMVAYRMKVVAAAVAMMMGSTAAMAAGQLVLCNGASGLSTVVQNGGLNPGVAPANGCTNDGRDFALISDDNGTAPDYIKLGSGTVEIMAADRISMLTRVDMNGKGIMNLADGAVSSASKEAINGSQLYSLASSTANALGGGAAVNSNGTWSSPTYNIGGQQFNNVGDALSNLDSRIVQSSGAALVKQDPATHNITVAKDTDGTVVDVTGTQGARQVTGVGAGALAAYSTDAVNGSQLYQTNVQVDALNQRVQNISLNGSSLVASQANDSPASATGANATAIGNGAQATAANSVALGDHSVASEDNTVSVGSAGNERRVTNVGAGALTADSTDAVIGSQLYQTNVEVNALNQRVQNISIGGSSVVASQATDSPASATGANATAIGNGAQATAANSVALGDRSVASEDNTVSVGSAGNERRVTNVAAGVRGTDAANMNQLNALQSNVNAVAREAFAGVAAAMAMPNLTPNKPGNTLIAAGVANYKGYTAVGLGGTYRSENNHWLVNAAASFTPHGDTGVRGQVGYEF